MEFFQRMKEEKGGDDTKSSSNNGDRKSFTADAVDPFSLEHPPVVSAVPIRLTDRVTSGSASLASSPRSLRHSRQREQHFEDDVTSQPHEENTINDSLNNTNTNHKKRGLRSPYLVVGASILRIIFGAILIILAILSTPASNDSIDSKGGMYLFVLLSGIFLIASELMELSYNEIMRRRRDEEVRESSNQEPSLCWICSRNCRTLICMLSVIGSFFIAFSQFPVSDFAFLGCLLLTIGQAWDIYLSLFRSKDNRSSMGVIRALLKIFAIMGNACFFNAGITGSSDDNITERDFVLLGAIFYVSCGVFTIVSFFWRRIVSCCAGKIQNEPDQNQIGTP